MPINTNHLIPIKHLDMPFVMLADKKHYLAPAMASYGIFSTQTHRLLGVLDGELIETITSATSIAVGAPHFILIIAVCKTFGCAIPKINVYQMNGKFLRTLPGIPVGNIAVTTAKIGGSICPILIAGCKESEHYAKLLVRMWRLDTDTESIIKQVVLRTDRRVRNREKVNIILFRRVALAQNKTLIFISYPDPEIEENDLINTYSIDLEQHRTYMTSESQGINQLLAAETIINGPPSLQVILAAANDGLIHMGCAGAPIVLYSKVTVHHTNSILSMVTTELLVDNIPTKVVISSSLDGTVKVWNLNSREVLETITELGVIHCLGLAENSNGQYLMTAGPKATTARGVLSLKELALRAVRQQHPILYKNQLPPEYRLLAREQQAPEQQIEATWSSYFRTMYHFIRESFLR